MPYLLDDSMGRGRNVRSLVNVFTSDPSGAG
jgi:hypothetical protein